MNYSVFRVTPLVSYLNGLSTVFTSGVKWAPTLAHVDDVDIEFFTSISRVSA